MRRGGKETENTQNTYIDYKDRRGDMAGASPSCLLASIDIIPFVSMMKRE
jgi:hypothetical protein